MCKRWKSYFSLLFSFLITLRFMSSKGRKPPKFTLVKYPFSATVPLIEGSLFGESRPRRCRFRTLLSKAIWPCAGRSTYTIRVIIRSGVLGTSAGFAFPIAGSSGTRLDVAETEEAPLTSGDIEAYLPIMLAAATAIATIIKAAAKAGLGMLTDPTYTRFHQPVDFKTRLLWSLNVSINLRSSVDDGGGTELFPSNSSRLNIL